MNFLLPLVVNKSPVTPPTRTSSKQCQIMVLSRTDETEVSKIFQTLNNKQRYGHDGISNEMLKCCSPIDEKYIVKAFSTCIDTQNFQNFLKS